MREHASSTAEAIVLPEPLPGEAGPYCLFGTALAKKGLGDLLGERLLALVEPTRREAGVLEYHVHRNRADSDRFEFYEAWTSVDHLRAHLSHPYIECFLKDRMNYLAHDMEIQFVRMLSRYPQRGGYQSTQDLRR